MSTGFLDLIRKCRAPLVAVTVGLLVLQSVVAGLATAQAATRLAGVPPDTICHGAADHGAPDSQPARDACCTACTVAAPALLPIIPRLASCLKYARNPNFSGFTADRVCIGQRAVRAGPSQGPPRFA